MLGRILALVLVVIGALSALPALASAANAPARYYVALGDSLSQGVQPDVQGVSRYTDQGYVDQLFQIERRRIPALRLVKLGCGGDTTGSMLTGHGNERDARFFHCDRTGGSQLKAAELFLRAHHQRGEVALVSIDIGANNVDGCASAGANLLPCVTGGEAAIKHDVPLLLRGIKRAAPPGTAFAGMTLYDPVLSGYFSTNSSVKTLADASTAFLGTINGILVAADRAAGFRTADVAGAFKSYDSADKVAYNGQMIPVNVARVCSWTWACTPPPSGPNIHANKNGYAVIAGAFARALGRLR